MYPGMKIWLRVEASGTEGKTAVDVVEEVSASAPVIVDVVSCADVEVDGQGR